MPWQSKAQQRWGHTAAGEKALGGASSVHEWDQATNFNHLPERKTMAFPRHKVDLGGKGKSFDVKEGSLHAMLHIPEDEKIGQKRIQQARHSRNPIERRKAISALGLTHMHHGA